jgi:hypothetical protein
MFQTLGSGNYSRKFVGSTAKKTLEDSLIRLLPFHWASKIAWRITSTVKLPKRAYTAATTRVPQCGQDAVKSLSLSDARFAIEPGCDDRGVGESVD